MKKFFRRIQSLVLVCGLVLSVLPSLTAGAAAGFEDFQDVQGHWAEPTLRQAYADGLIKGYSAAKMGPDDPISAAQMVTILCRVLGATRQADVSGMGIGTNAWYHDAAAQAVYLGFLSPSAGDLNGNMTRLNVMLMMAEAFQLERAEPDAAAAESYPDFAGLTGKARRVVATLVGEGYIEGYGGSLMLHSAISRAEFLTILYRVAANYLPAASADPALPGGSVLSGDLALSGVSFAQKLWADCSCQNVSLSGLRAGTVTIRADSLASLSISGSSYIDRLVLGASGGDLSVAPWGGASVHTLAVGAGGGAVTVSGSVTNVEITGSNRTVYIDRSADRLVVTGSGCAVTLSAGNQVGEIVLLGTNNTVTLNGTARTLTVSASGCALKGAGRIVNLVLNRAADISVAVGNTQDNTDRGIAGTTVAVSTVQTAVSIGDVLTATAAITPAVTGKTCTGTWYVGGAARQTQEIALETGVASTLSCPVQYISGMSESLAVYFVLSYTTEEGEIQEVASEPVYVTVEVDEYLTSEERVLTLVQDNYMRYLGNYTLAWAQTHDYEDFEKEIWVNAKGYSSTSDYLIWVNIAYQRVNIFQGSRGNWTLVKSCIVGTGAYGATPAGVFKLTYKQDYGWTTASYTVAPVVGFKGGGYAFHSRLYYPGTATSNDANLKDPTIGYPCSHGCIRMYTPDVWWIHDNVPVGTTVVCY